MPIRVDELGRISSYEAHEALPADYFGPVEAPAVEPEPEPAPDPKPAPRRNVSRASAPKPTDEKPETEHTHRVTTTTEAQGPVQQTRLTMGKSEETTDAAPGGHTGGSGDSSHVPGHSD